ncbi:DNA-directed RNA polymerase [Agyrium rufum]|nr:DNA-directed RNA polymerase [Agyrium rufum]
MSSNGGVVRRPNLRSTNFSCPGYVQLCLNVDNDPVTRASTRNYAYAATNNTVFTSDEYIPFDASKSSGAFASLPQGAWGPPQDSTSLDFDPHSPIIIKDSLTKAPRNFRSTSGVGGELPEIYETLLACLHVGRFDRAAATMRRLNDIFKPEAPELIAIHNEYLGYLIDKLARTQDGDLLQDVQRWYKYDLQNNGIQPNALTIALMTRASLYQADTTARHSNVISHFLSADVFGCVEETLEVLQSTLTVDESEQLNQILPNEFAIEEDTSLNEEFESQAESLGNLEYGMIDPEILSQTDSPYVRPTEQKGLGLEALNRSLASFNTPKENDLDAFDGSEEEKQVALNHARQLRLEQDTLQSAMDRWDAEHKESLQRGASGMSEMQSMGGIVWQWHQAMIPIIKQVIRKANDAEAAGFKGIAESERTPYGPFLQYLPPEKLAATTILALMQALCTGGIRRLHMLTKVISAIGGAIEDESMAQVVKKDSTEQEWKKMSSLEESRKMYAIKQKYMSVLSEQNQHALSAWSYPIRCGVGAAMLSIICQAAKIEVTQTNARTGETSKEMQPVFWHSFFFSKGVRRGILKVNDAVQEKFTKTPMEFTLAKYLPMVVPPKPWVDFNKGGYLTHRLQVIRTKADGSQTRAYVRAAAGKGDLKQVFAGLDVLGKTGWKINRPLFDVMLEAWNSGQAFANFTEEDPKIEYPPEPDTREYSKEKKVWAYKVKEIQNALAANHSQRCYHNFQLQIAKAYLNDTFYFPHNVDFRGRAYPIPPYLNHLGSDHCRGLLRFAVGKPLGETGLYWLKVHLANVYGYDKASFSERRQFSEDHLEDIFDSAENPMGGKRWWYNAEDPWQCLATCMELTNALKSPEPTAFVSHLPVHQDGTCNGLQHYAALGGDLLGAAQVNLEPSDRPSDIYTAVAEMVKADVSKNAAAGDRIAKMLEGRITRKVVKQTVMTNVYGVTFNGALAQVEKQLRLIFADSQGKTDAPIGIMTFEIVKSIFGSIGRMFTGATAIQAWFVECAKRISLSISPDQVAWLEADAHGQIEKSPYAGIPTNAKKAADEQSRFKSSVVWTSPLKLPVVQPYRSAVSSRNLPTVFQNVKLNITTPADPVARKKQLQAFPPNFIHSLDATHMILSAIKCDQLGLTFASVHDSFWTHPSDVNIMNRVIREAFIKMHSDDIVGRLASEFDVRYKDHMQLVSVKLNSPVGKKIVALRGKVGASQLASKLSQYQKSELLLEAQRQRLLASNDPEERAKGEAMITPAKILESVENPNEFLIEDDITATLGNIEASAAEGADSPDLASEGAEPEDSFAPSAELPDTDLDADAAEDTSAEEASFEGDVVTDAFAPEESDNSPQQNRGAYSVLRDPSELKNHPETHEEIEQLYASIDRSREVRAEKLRARGRRLTKQRATWVWMPLKFPPKPEKGAFDVSRLMKSSYFFS